MFILFVQQPLEVELQTFQHCFWQQTEEILISPEGPHSDTSDVLQGSSGIKITQRKTSTGYVQHLVAERSPAYRTNMLI